MSCSTCDSLQLGLGYSTIITSASWTRRWSVPCARLSTKSDLTVNCALSSSWLQVSITSASRCTNSTRSGRRRCDVELLNQTSPRFDCASVWAMANLDTIWGIHDLGRINVSESRTVEPFHL